MAETPTTDRYLVRLKRRGRKAIVTLPNGELFSDRTQARVTAERLLVEGEWTSCAIETVFAEGGPKGYAELIEVRDA